MSRWFRFYAEALDDPKVQRLDGETFKAWVNLLCLANRNHGFLPGIEDIAFALRIDNNAARTLVERLLNATLIDRLNGGANGCRYAPHGWEERQYKSDTSTDRVKRFRQRSKTVTETPPDTETDTETEKKEITPPKGGQTYVFEGKIIRLMRREFKTWAKAYPAIDLVAALQSRDDWLASEADEKTRKKWFLSTSNHLANLQQKARSAAYDRDRITV